MKQQNYGILISGFLNNKGVFSMLDSQFRNLGMVSYSTKVFVAISLVVTFLPMRSVIFHVHRDVASHGQNRFMGSVSVKQRYEFRPTDSLKNAYQHHTTTMLPNGSVLVVGDSEEGRFCASEIYDTENATWNSTDRVQQLRARWADTSPLLDNGKVMVMGGYVLLQQYELLRKAELYDFQSGTWTPASSALAPRWGYMSTILPNGSLLVAGGYDSTGNITASAEEYDYQTDTWSATASMLVPRSSATMTRMNNGKILVVAGVSGYQDYPTTAEIYDPITGNWSLLSTPLGIRWGHTATLLSNGQVLVLGGRSVRFDSDGIPQDQYLDDAWLFDPAKVTWRSTNSMGMGRWQHSAILLDDGTVFVSGGVNSQGTLASSEIYEPATETWEPINDMAETRRLHTMTKLPNGDVLIVGNESPKVDILDVIPSNTLSATLDLPYEVTATVPISVHIDAVSSDAPLVAAALGDDLAGFENWFPLENGVPTVTNWTFDRTGMNIPLYLRLRDVNGQEANVITATVKVGTVGSIYLPFVRN